ncbi:snf2 domain containing protein [Plasmopara halstedii]|uniref:Snf2 domain containing protein n=1 Tax=Plasmopara halstedii TaxID=4781 RepID=A0A0N7L659_PLAHL|nr:snf2 domain containing protein [Plasmopara halstedii]CEG43363.1 snf2 domain containing protein [Plasmopara halstedii]|eukprot:XP_024579732.1 snf2 domain containing protein [Plasmopara halstedii]
MSRSKRKNITQVSIDAFVGTDAAARVAEDVHFKICRCGVLADAIGMGKTATMLALIADEPRDYAVGANLLVAPSHLLAQWKHEVSKFFKSGEVEVVLGLKQYMEIVENPAARVNMSNRMLVLVGVEEAVKSKNYYYKHGKLYSTGLRGKRNLLRFDSSALLGYEEAAKFVHKAYCGPLWVTQLHRPYKPWRRVIFEEVQDIVFLEKKALDCFIQLTHRCLNVWLITATPFPGKAESLNANNQLLGFKRLRLQPYDPAFDEIKRKLYLRNCAQVKQRVITDKIRVNETYIPIKLHPVELILYQVERVWALEQSEYNLFDVEDGDDHSKKGAAKVVVSEPQSAVESLSNMLWSPQYKSARQSCVHAGISDRLFEREQSSKQNNSSEKLPTPALVKIKSPSEVFRDEIYHVNRQLAVATKRKKEVNIMENATRNTVEICRVIYSNTYASVRDCFEDMEASGLSKFFDDNGETDAGFRMLYKHYPFGDDTPEPTELLFYYHGEIKDYLLKYFETMEKIKKLANVMEFTLIERCLSACAIVEEQLKQLTECIALVNSVERHKDKFIETAPVHGSKIAALVQYLSRMSTIKVVVFTMWDRALRVIDKALRLASISCAVFLQHQSSETKSAHVASFLGGDIQVLILNSLTSASGINLQVASHVIFLDPVGFSPTQASTLEEQAIGRVLRMGQINSSVTVVRFIAEDTMEATLYDDIHKATAKANAADDSFFDGKREDSYVCVDYSAPLRRVVRMFTPAEGRAQIEDEEIQIEGSMSIEEAITRRIEQAEAEGKVFDLTDDVLVENEHQVIDAQTNFSTHQRKKRKTHVSEVSVICGGEAHLKIEPHNEYM